MRVFQGQVVKAETAEIFLKTLSYELFP